MNKSTIVSAYGKAMYQWGRLSTARDVLNNFEPDDNHPSEEKAWDNFRRKTHERIWRRVRQVRKFRAELEGE